MELLPCPFCGADGTIRTSTRSCYVACGCTAEGPTSYSSPEEARTMWNTRSEGAYRGGLVGMYFTVFVFFHHIPAKSEAGWGVVDRQLADDVYLVKYVEAERAVPVVVPYRSVLLLEHMSAYHFFDAEEEARLFFEQVRGLIRSMTPAPSTELPS